MSLIEYLLKGDGEGMARLLGEGVSADTADERGNTALHLAAGLGYTDYVTWLIEAGATVNLPNRVGQTALHFAARYGQTDAVQALVVKGADAGLRDSAGQSAWALANKHHHAQAMALLPPDGAQAAAVTMAEKPVAQSGPVAVADMTRTEEEGGKKPSALQVLLAKLKGGGKAKKPRTRVVLIVELLMVALLVAVVGVYVMAFKTRGEMMVKRKQADEAVTRADQMSRELGDDTMAAPELLNAMVIDPDYSVIYFKYAAIQAKLGSLGEADQYYRLGAEAAEREARNASIHKTAWHVFARLVGLEKKNLEAGLVPPGPIGGGAPAPAPEVSPSAQTTEVSESTALSESKAVEPPLPQSGSQPAGAVSESIP